METISDISLFIFLNILLSGIITQILKHIIGRPRPVLYNGFELKSLDIIQFDSKWHSFPSGHTATIFAFIFCTIFLFPKIKNILSIKFIILNTKKILNIAIIGKYVNLKDAYKSLDEALTHGGIHNKVKVNLIRIESDKLKTSKVKEYLKNVSGILIPGGFGKRGTEGKIACIKYAREKKIPFLGICFGMQMAIIEFARNKLKIKNAGSTELEKKCYPAIGLINEWNKDGKIIKGTDTELGGTMRLGLYEAKLKNNSAIKKIYKSNKIHERHRHRYEVNINLKDSCEKQGLIFSGMSPDNNLPEIIELKNHPWFIGVQFHPEFKSRPLSPHPLFSSFIKASKSHNEK